MPYLNKMLLSPKYLKLLFSQSIHILSSAFLILLTYPSYTQDIENTSIHDLNGIWIEKGFYTSFEKHKSILKSKNSFAYELPVGIRINSEEKHGDTFNIGYGVLHSHFLSPEVSRHTIIDGEKFEEQGSLDLIISDSNSHFPYNVGYIEYFNEENSSSYLGVEINQQDTTLILFRKKSPYLPQDTLRYIRICNKFQPEHKSPNPIYYYTLNRVISGKYKLLSPSNEVLSDKITIKNNGSIVGFDSLKSKRINYSTDVYCGQPKEYDIITIYDYPVKNYRLVYHKYFTITRQINGEILLHDYNIRSGVQKELAYILKPR